MSIEILEVIDLVMKVDLKEALDLVGTVDAKEVIDLTLKAAAVGLTALKLYLDEKNRKRCA